MMDVNFLTCNSNGVWTCFPWSLILLNHWKEAKQIVQTVKLLIMFYRKEIILWKKEKKYFGFDVIQNVDTIPKLTSLRSAFLEHSLKGFWSYKVQNFPSMDVEYWNQIFWLWLHSPLHASSGALLNWLIGTTGVNLT